MLTQRIRLAALADSGAAFNIAKALENLFNNQPLTTGNLRISGGSAAATFETQNAVLGLVNGVTVSMAVQSAKAVPSAITWAGVASVFQAGGFVVTMDATGTLRTIPTNVGTGASAAAALAAVKWPLVPEGQVAIGGAVIANTAANTAFTAGTTNLDAANISTTFFNLSDALYPLTSMS